MSLPVGTVIRLLNAKGMVGSLGALYKSIESLSSDYFQPSLDKESLLKPVAPVNVPLLALNDAPSTDKSFYRCNYYNNSGCNYYTDTSGTHCRNCNREMTTVLNYVAPTGSQNTTSASTGSDGTSGYVKGVVTYMVMDNLEVKPMSTISGITLMNKFNVKDVSALADKEVQLGLNEGLAMLKASMDQHRANQCFPLEKEINIGLTSVEASIIWLN